MSQPHDDQPGQGQPPYGQPPYGQPTPPPGQQPPQWQQQQHGQPPYGQPQYGQPQYGQPPQQWGPPGYGQYGAPQQYGRYGGTSQPSRPPHVVAAAVLGFVFGAFGALATLAAVLLGVAAGGVDDAPPGFQSVADAAAGVAIVIGLLALAWTVVLIWGSVWALVGRSRVLLLVGGSIALFFSGLGFAGNLGDSSAETGDVVFGLLLFLGSLAIVVLLSLAPSAQFFAAHRTRRHGG